MKIYFFKADSYFSYIVTPKYAPCSNQISVFHFLTLPIGHERVGITKEYFSDFIMLILMPYSLVCLNQGTDNPVWPTCVQLSLLQVDVPTAVLSSSVVFVGLILCLCVFVVIIWFQELYEPRLVEILRLLIKIQAINYFVCLEITTIITKNNIRNKEMLHKRSKNVFLWETLFGHFLFANI